MSQLNKKIGIWGAGNMGEAFIGALIRSKLSEPSQITVSDILEERLNVLETTYGISVTKDNIKLFAECDVVILAVKPQQTAELLSQISRHKEYGLSGRKLLISIAAGIPIRKIEETLYASLDEPSREKLPIARVMPNTPALVLAGISGMSTNRYASPEDVQITKTILGAIGQALNDSNR